MGEIDWGTLAAKPVTQTPINAFMAGFQGGRQMALQRTGDEARADALAHPTDMNALTKFAVYDPEGAKSLMGVQDYQRQLTAQNAAGDFVSSYGQPQVQPIAPQPGNAPSPAFSQAFAPEMGQQAQQQPEAHPLDLANPALGQIGAATTSGERVDPTQAFATIMRNSPQLATQVLQNIGQMDDVRRARLSESNEYMGRAALSLLQVPQSQRAQILTQMAPELQQHGVTADNIKQALATGVSDQFLHQVVGQSVTVSGAIDQANKDRQFGLESRQADTQAAAVADNIRYHSWEMQRPQQVAPGAALVGPNGNVVYDPLGGGGSSGNYTGGWTPRARNGGDNSDAAVDGKIAGAAKFLGVSPTDSIAGLDPMRIAQAMTLSEGGKGSLADRNNNPGNLKNPDGTFKKFPTKEAGLAAAAELVKRKLANGQTTVQSLVEGLPQGGGGAIEGQAQAIAAGRQPPLTGRAAATGVGARIMQRAYQINPDLDSRMYKGEEKALVDFLGGKNANLVRSASVAMDHLNTLGGAALALNNGNVTVFNRLGQAFASATGQAAPTNFDAVKGIVAQEVAKFVGGGEISDARFNAVMGNINRASSPAQLKGYIAEVQALIAGQLHGLKNQYEQTTGKNDFDRFLSPAAKQIVGAIGTKKAGGGKVTVSNW